MLSAMMVQLADIVRPLIWLVMMLLREETALKKLLKLLEKVLIFVLYAFVAVSRLFSWLLRLL
jgi:hypothetical protein